MPTNGVTLLFEGCERLSFRLPREPSGVQFRLKPPDTEL